MAAEDKTILVKIEVQEAQAKVNIKKLESSIKSLDGRTKEYTLAIKKLAAEEIKLQEIQSKKIQLNNQQATSNKQLASSVQGVSKSSGAASAATLELGRAISDAPYGIRGVANNVSQFASQIAFMSRSMDAATGKAIGLGGAMKSLWSSIMGPLGILLAIQAAIAALDYFAGSTKKAEEGLESFEESSITKTVAKLTLLKKALDDSSVSLENKNSLLAKASTEFEELNVHTADTEEGINDVTVALDAMITKMKEVAFAKAVLSALEDTMKKLVLTQAKGVEGVELGWFDTLKSAFSLIRVNEAKAYVKEVGKLDGVIENLYNLLKKEQEGGEGLLIELLYGKDAKKGGAKKGSKRVNKIFKETVFSLQKEINKFVKDNEKLLTKNVFDLLAIDQEAEKEAIELKRTSYLEKNKIRYDNFIAQESARRKMTKEEFMQTKEGLAALETLNYDYAFAGLERDEAIAKLEILQIQQTNALKLKLFEKYQAEVDKGNLKRAKRTAKSSKSFGSTEAGSLGRPTTNAGASNIENYEKSQRELWEAEDKLFEERFEDKSIELLKLVTDGEMSLIDQETILGNLRLEQQQDIADRELQLEIDKINAKKNVNQEYISWTQGLASIFKNIAGDNEALAKLALVIEKGAAIADIVVRTQAANAVIKANTLMQASAVGLLNPAAAPIIAAGTAAVTKNNIGSGISIAKILSTTLNSKGQSGGNTSGGGGGGAASQDREFDFNLIGSTGVNQLAQGIAGQFNQPIQTYVVGSQITSQQQMDATIQSNASIG